MNTIAKLLPLILVLAASMATNVVAQYPCQTCSFTGGIWNPNASCMKAPPYEIGYEACITTASNSGYATCYFAGSECRTYSAMMDGSALPKGGSDDLHAGIESVFVSSAPDPDGDGRAYRRSCDGVIVARNYSEDAAHALRRETVVLKL